MKLISPVIGMEKAFLEIAMEYKAHGEKYYQRELNDPSFDMSEYIKALEENSKGINMAPGRVQQSTFWLVDDYMDEIFGTSRLRHYLVPLLAIAGGHIGYDVPPSKRRKGYGTKLLKLTLIKARELGLGRVLVTCDFDNAGRKR